MTKRLCARLGGMLAVLALLPTAGLQAGVLGANAEGHALFARRAKENREAEILVRFKSGVSAADREAKHAAEGNRKLREFRRSGLHHVRISAAQPVEEAVDRYAADPDVQAVEANFVMRAQALPDDAAFRYLWALNNTGQVAGVAGTDIKAPLAWDRGTGSHEMVVMVIDSGIDYTHFDLAANMWVNPLEIPGNGIDDDANGYVDDVHGIDVVNSDSDPMDDNGHGTHVAGTIGAVGHNGVGITGVNWRVKLIACKALDGENLEATVDQVVECLEYARALKARGVNIVATNNSYGGLEAAPLALAEAISAQPDILYVTAAGNFGLDNDSVDYYPGNFSLPNVLTVAATDASDAKAGFSDYGRRTVHLGAPGVDIYSTVPFGGILPAQGTSMATPHVAGLAALLKSQNPALDARALRNLILTGGDPVASLQGKSVSGRRLNAANAADCNNRPLFSALKLPTAFTVGAPSTVSVLSLNCASPAGPVTGLSSAGQAFTLLDDGVAPDLLAGDGEFTLSWTPGEPFSHIDFTSAAGSERVSTIDLTVAGVSGPTAAAVGTSITVSVTVGNTSGSVAPASALSLLLSADGLVDAADRVLATVPVPTINANSQVVVPVTVTLPVALGEGVFFLGAQVDPADQVAESNEANNSATGTVLSISNPTVDLRPSAVSAPATGLAGGTITVSASVVNEGSTPAGASTLSFYLTRGGQPTAADTLLGTATIEPLAAGASQLASGSVTLPAALVPGDYSIGAIADSSNVVLERDEANNAQVGNTIRVAAPRVDLVVQAVGNPLVARNGRPIALTATLANQGLDGAPASSLRWYLSSDATITTDDLPLGSVSTAALAAAGTGTASLSVRVPNDVPEGLYYIGAIADPDNLVGETDNGNNAGLSPTALTVKYTVDLVMTEVLGPTEAATGQSVTFQGTLRNKGLEAVGEVTVGFYLSAGETIGLRDRLVAVGTVPSVGPGASVPVVATAVLRTDLPKRTFYVGAIADPGNLVAESRNRNNELAAVEPVVVRHGPDLMVSELSAPSEALRGGSFVVDTVVANVGEGAIGAASDQAVIAKGSTIEVGIYLSPNAGITASDLLVGRASFSALAAGASLPLSVNVSLPPDLPPGRYFVGAIADRNRALREASEQNNALAGGRITVR